MNTTPHSTTLHPKISRAEWGLLVVLAAIQFTNILDFVIVMPLAPLAKVQFQITSEQFGHIVGSYGFAACLGSLLASKFLDGFDRKQAVLWLYGGFTICTLFCGLAPTYEWMLVARASAGFFGGVIGAAVMAIVGDVFADYRRGTATGVVMSAFAVASVIGVPLGMFLAEAFGAGAPFTALAGLSAIVWVGALLLLPSLRTHLQNGTRTLSVWVLAKNPNHALAYTFNFCLTTSGFLVVPFIADAMVRNAGQQPTDVKYIYLVGGLVTFVSTNLIGRFSDRYGKKHVFRIVAMLAIIMALVVTHLPPVPLVVVLLACTGFMVFMSGRFVPAQALITASAKPEVRGGFLSLNSAIGFLAMGVASTVSGILVGDSDAGPLPGYPLVGYLSTAFALMSLFLVGLLRMADRTPATPEPTTELAEVIV